MKDRIKRKFEYSFSAANKEFSSGAQVALAVILGAPGIWAFIFLSNWIIDSYPVAGAIGFSIFIVCVFCFSSAIYEFAKAWKESE